MTVKREKMYSACKHVVVQNKKPYLTANDDENLSYGTSLDLDNDRQICGILTQMGADFWKDGQVFWIPRRAIDLAHHIVKQELRLAEIENK